MSDDNQLYVAPSFQCLYRDARGRWTLPPREVAMPVGLSSPENRDDMG